VLVLCQRLGGKGGVEVHFLCVFYFVLENRKRNQREKKKFKTVQNIQRGLCTVYIGLVLIFENNLQHCETPLQTDRLECYYENQRGLIANYILCRLVCVVY